MKRETRREEIRKENFWLTIKVHNKEDEKRQQILQYILKKTYTDALDQAYQYGLQQWRREGIDDTLSSLPVDFSNMADPRYETIARLQEWYIAKHKEMLEPLSTEEVM